MLTTAQIKILECLRLDPNILPKDVHVKLGITKSTVHEQLSRIYVRLGVANWREALAVYSKSLGEDPAQSQFELQQRWNQSSNISIDQRVTAFIVKLDIAERLMRELLEPPIIHRQWPKVIPELLVALERLNKARSYLQQPKQKE